MKRYYTWQLYFLFLTLLTGVGFAEENTPNFAELPKAHRSGFVVSANGFKIPAYSLTVERMWGFKEEGLETFIPQERNLDIKIKPKIAAQLEAYAYREHVVTLVPKGWIPGRAWQAAIDYTFTFAPAIDLPSEGCGGGKKNETCPDVIHLLDIDTSTDSYLSIYCTTSLGTACSKASSFFEKAKILAACVFDVDEDTVKEIEKESEHIIPSVSLDPFQKAYHVDIPNGNPIDGLVYFDPNNMTSFCDKRIRISAKQHAIATAVLNQFVIKH